MGGGGGKGGRGENGEYNVVSALSGTRGARLEASRKEGHGHGCGRRLGHGFR